MDIQPCLALFLQFPANHVFPLFETVTSYLFLLQTHHIPSSHYGTSLTPPEHKSTHICMMSFFYPSSGGRQPSLHLCTRSISIPLLCLFKIVLLSSGSSNHLCLWNDFHQHGHMFKYPFSIKDNSAQTKKILNLSLPFLFSSDSCISHFPGRDKHLRRSSPYTWAPFPLPGMVFFRIPIWLASSYLSDLSLNVTSSDHFWSLPSFSLFYFSLIPS